MNINCLLCGRKSKVAKLVSSRKTWLYCCASCLAEPNTTADTCCQCHSVARYYRPHNSTGYICILCYFKNSIIKERDAINNE